MALQSVLAVIIEGFYRSVVTEIRQQLHNLVAKLGMKFKFLGHRLEWPFFDGFLDGRKISRIPAVGFNEIEQLTKKLLSDR